ncbi:spidroin 2B variant 1 [Trichonephila clavipes]|uniref:Spidroin 2B variant 1 n=1 Tax=Trichonephila clavipes TaxID=2585209 RepID=A0A8X7BL56_TRICX|nr:spidroin 2B variant 1 [Trichonephila clavipes]
MSVLMSKTNFLLMIFGSIFTRSIMARALINSYNNDWNSIGGNVLFTNNYIRPASKLFSTFFDSLYKQLLDNPAFKMMFNARVDNKLATDIGKDIANVLAEEFRLDTSAITKEFINAATHIKSGSNAETFAKVLASTCVKVLMKNNILKSYNDLSRIKSLAGFITGSIYIAAEDDNELEDMLETSENNIKDDGSFNTNTNFHNQMGYENGLNVILGTDSRSDNNELNYGIGMNSGLQFASNMNFNSDEYGRGLEVNNELDEGSSRNSWQNTDFDPFNDNGFSAGLKSRSNQNINQELFEGFNTEKGQVNQDSEIKYESKLRKWSNSETEVDPDIAFFPHQTKVFGTDSYPKNGFMYGVNVDDPIKSEYAIEFDLKDDTDTRNFDLRDDSRNGYHFKPGTSTDIDPRMADDINYAEPFNPRSSKNSNNRLSDDSNYAENSDPTLKEDNHNPKRSVPTSNADIDSRLADDRNADRIDTSSRNLDPNLSDDSDYTERFDPQSNTNTDSGFGDEAQKSDPRSSKNTQPRLEDNNNYPERYFPGSNAITDPNLSDDRDFSERFDPRSNTNTDPRSGDDAELFDPESSSNTDPRLEMMSTTNTDPKLSDDTNNAQSSDPSGKDIDPNLADDGDYADSSDPISNMISDPNSANDRDYADNSDPRINTINDPNLRNNKDYSERFDPRSNTNTDTRSSDDTERSDSRSTKNTNLKSRDDTNYAESSDPRSSISADPKLRDNTSYAEGSDPKRKNTQPLLKDNNKYPERSDPRSNTNTDSRLADDRSYADISDPSSKNIDPNLADDSNYSEPSDSKKDNTNYATDMDPGTNTFIDPKVSVNGSFGVPRDSDISRNDDPGLVDGKYKLAGFDPKKSIKSDQVLENDSNDRLSTDSRTTKNNDPKLDGNSNGSVNFNVEINTGIDSKFKNNNNIEAKFDPQFINTEGLDIKSKKKSQAQETRNGSGYDGGMKYTDDSKFKIQSGIDLYDDSNISTDTDPNFNSKSVNKFQTGKEAFASYSNGQNLGKINVSRTVFGSFDDTRINPNLGVNISLDSKTGTRAVLDTSTGMNATLDPNIQMDASLDPSVGMKVKLDSSAGMKATLDPNVQMDVELDPNVGVDVSLDSNTGLSSALNASAGMKATLDPNVQMDASLDPSVGMKNKLDSSTGMKDTLDPNVQMDIELDPNVGVDVSLDSNTRMSTALDASAGMKATLDPNVQTDASLDSSVGMKVKLDSSTGMKDTLDTNVQMDIELDPNVGFDVSLDSNTGMSTALDASAGMKDTLDPNVQMDIEFDPNVGSDVSLDSNTGMSTALDTSSGMKATLDPKVQMDASLDPSVGKKVKLDSSTVMKNTLDPNVQMDIELDPNVGRGTELDPNIGMNAALDPNVGLIVISDPNVGIKVALDPKDNAGTKMTSDVESSTKESVNNGRETGNDLRNEAYIGKSLKNKSDPSSSIRVENENGLNAWLNVDSSFNNERSLAANYDDSIDSNKKTEEIRDELDPGLQMRSGINLGMIDRGNSRLNSELSLSEENYDSKGRKNVDPKARIISGMVLNNRIEDDPESEKERKLKNMQNTKDELDPSDDLNYPEKVDAIPETRKVGTDDEFVGEEDPNVKLNSEVKTGEYDDSTNFDPTLTGQNFPNDADIEINEKDPRYVKSMYLKIKGDSSNYNIIIDPVEKANNSKESNSNDPNVRVNDPNTSFKINDKSGIITDFDPNIDTELPLSFKDKNKQDIDIDYFDPIEIDPEIRPKSKLVVLQMEKFGTDMKSSFDASKEMEIDKEAYLKNEFKLENSANTNLEKSLQMIGEDGLSIDSKMNARPEANENSGSTKAEMYANLSHKNLKALFKKQLKSHLMSDKSFKRMFSRSVPQVAVSGLNSFIAQFLVNAFSLPRPYILALESNLNVLGKNELTTSDLYANRILTAFSDILEIAKVFVPSAINIQVDIALNAIVNAIKNFISSDKNPYDSKFSFLNGLEVLPYANFDAVLRKYPIISDNKGTANFKAKFLHNILISKEFSESIRLGMLTSSWKNIAKHLGESMAEAFGSSKPSVFTSMYENVLLSIDKKSNVEIYARSIANATERILSELGYFTLGNPDIKAFVAETAVIKALDKTLCKDNSFVSRKRRDMSVTEVNMDVRNTIGKNAIPLDIGEINMELATDTVKNINVDLMDASLARLCANLNLKLKMIRNTKEKDVTAYNELSLSKRDVLNQIMSEKLQSSTAMYTAISVAGFEKVVSLIAQSMAQQFGYENASLFSAIYNVNLTNIDDNNFTKGISAVAKASRATLEKAGVLSSEITVQYAEQLSTSIANKISLLIASSLDYDDGNIGTD